MKDSLSIDSNYENSLFYDLVRARSYVLLLENIVKNNKKDIFSQISFSALIDSLISTVCRMYDYGSKVGNIQKEVRRINDIFKKENNNDDCDEKLVLDNIIGLDKEHKTENFKKLLTFRDKCVAHKDSNWNEIYDELRKSRILELVEPFLDFAEKIYDKNPAREKGRKEVIESIILDFKKEEVKNGK